MRFVYGDPAAYAKSMQQGSAAAFISVFCVVLVALALAYRREYVGAAVCLALAFPAALFFHSIASYPYSSNTFLAASVTPTEAQLEFPGRSTVVVPREDIAALYFGSPGKMPTCYLHFELRSGASFNSATIPGMRCKEDRQRILSLMQL